LEQKIEIIQGDIAQISVIEKALEKVKILDWPPVKAIFHLAMILKDSMLPNMSIDDFENIWAAKAQGAWNLHTLTKSMSLNYFVMFSSISSVIGNKGQANYAAANEYLDALVVERQRLNLASLSVNIGSIVDVGVVAQDKRLRKMMEAQGVYGITSTSIFTNLEVILTTENAPSRVILQPAMWKGIYDNFVTMKTQVAHLVRYQDASETNTGELTEENKKRKIVNIFIRFIAFCEGKFDSEYAIITLWCRFTYGH